MSLPILRLKGDPIIWVIYFLLCAISIIEIFSASSTLSYHKESYWSPVIKQAAMLGGGTLFCVAVHHLKCNFFKFLILVYPFALALLCYTAFSGSEVNGASRWIHLLGFTIQPSEIAKGVLIATVALTLWHNKEGGGVNDKAWRAVFFYALPMVAIIFKENISTAAFLALIIYILMIVAGVPRKQWLIMGAVCAGFGAIGLFSLQYFPDDADDPFYKEGYGTMLKRIPTGKARLFGETLVITEDPDSLVVTDKNMQVVHAYIAASCNNHGVGLMPGNSVQRDYLPQAYSDFIFAIIIEETGLWGSGIVLLLYLVLMFRIGVIARKCGQTFGAFLVMGLGIMLVGQALLNMIVATGLGPVTGQTLPLISRGGTSTIITCIYFGMIQSVAWSGIRTPRATTPALATTTEAKPADDIASSSTEDE